MHVRNGSNWRKADIRETPTSVKRHNRTREDRQLLAQSVHSQLAKPSLRHVCSQRRARSSTARGRLNVPTQRQHYSRPLLRRLRFRRHERAGLHPGAADLADLASEGLEAVREIVAALGGWGQANHMPPADIGELLHLADLDQLRLAGMPAHRQAGLEQHVRSRLALRLALGGAVVGTEELLNSGAQSVVLIVRDWGGT
jgi:hypothetical protein